MATSYANRLSCFLPTEDEISCFAGDDSANRLLGSFNRITAWFRLIHSLKGNEETSVLLASAHSKVIEIWVLIPLGLLHSSYMSLRTIVDICTSYTFYRTHPVEWRAVCVGRASWEGRSNIVEWHLRHTPSFREMNSHFGLANLLQDDYEKLSSYVHGVPVTGLPTLRAIERTRIDQSDLDVFLDVAEKVDRDLNFLFLAVCHEDLSSLAPRDFRTIVSGISRSDLKDAGITLSRT